MRIGTLTMALLVLAGCSSTGLDRGKGKRLIESYESFAAPVDSVDCQKEAVEAAEKEGIFRFKKGHGNMGSIKDPYVPDRWEVAPEGKKYFSEIGKGLMGWGCRVKLASPARLRVVEVTGIADAPLALGAQMKEVKYSWVLDLPEPVRRYTGAKGQGEGHAVLRLYDDGWRVEELQVF